LKKYNYPPDQHPEAVRLIMEQAQKRIEIKNNWKNKEKIYY
jgi:hypothetical protein